VNGNKRCARVVLETFIRLNGGTVDAGNTELVAPFEGLAGSGITEDELAHWFRERITA
jgi:death-on-curing protein